MVSLPDIAPTTFRIQVRSSVLWQAPTTVEIFCQWLDDALEDLAKRGIVLHRVTVVEFQSLHNHKWIPISSADLREAIERVQGGRR